MLEFFRKLFSADFMPHGMCYFWDPAVLWLNVTADSVIAASYYAIPFLLFYFVQKRRDVAFKGIFVAFAIFILACGSTHVLAAVTVWNPVYRLDGVIKAVTAVASTATTLLLIPLLPALIRLPSPAQLSKINRELEREVAERREAEEEVHRANQELEDRVARRTEELAQLVEDLRREMERRRETEQELVHSQKMEAVGRLAGGIAHDFNNLLTVILGYNEMLRERLQHDAEAMDYENEVLRAAERASALTHQLLAFGHRQVAAPRIIDLNQAVENIERMLTRIIGEDIELSIQTAPALRPVLADSSQIDQVVMNLAVNSRDAMPKGGRLTLRTSNVELTGDRAGGPLGLQPGSYVLLRVEDTGEGMDEATKSRIYEPFFTTKEIGKGTGLGLSIVYGIVKQAGGEILVASQLGHGTAFEIYLPAVTGPAAATPAETAEPDKGPAAETILVVEDEDQVRSLTCMMLARLGYQVLDCGSGAEAVRLAQEHPGTIHLLLTDVVMPGVNGIRLAQQMEEVRPGIGVLFMSGYADAGILSENILTNDHRYLEKPFTSAALQQKVREALRGV